MWLGGDWQWHGRMCIHRLWENQICSVPLAGQRTVSGEIQTKGWPRGRHSSAPVPGSVGALLVQGWRWSVNVPAPKAPRFCQAADHTWLHGTRGHGAVPPSGGAPHAFLWWQVIHPCRRTPGCVPSVGSPLAWLTGANCADAFRLSQAELGSMCYIPLSRVGWLILPC